jgi:predicted kinase
MATAKQRTAAKRNIKKARAAASERRTIAHLPENVRKDLGRQGARARARHGKPGRNLEDRSREQLYADAKRLNIRGRSRMGKWELIEAIRRAR